MPKCLNPEITKIPQIPQIPYSLIASSATSPTVTRPDRTADDDWRLYTQALPAVAPAPLHSSSQLAPRCGSWLACIYAHDSSAPPPTQVLAVVSPRIPPTPPATFLGVCRRSARPFSSAIPARSACPTEGTTTTCAAVVAAHAAGGRKRTASPMPVARSCAVSREVHAVATGAPVAELNQQQRPT
jgi:hypothetical protein